jgi:hypothetical protein
MLRLCFLAVCLGDTSQAHPAGDCSTGYFRNMRGPIRESGTGCPRARYSAFTAGMKSVFPGSIALIVETIILAGDVNAGDVIVLPDARDAVLVKQVRLGQGGFILTVVQVDNDRPEAQRLVTLTAAIRLRKRSSRP